MDDRRVGLLVRTLRRRRGWRQADLGAAAGVSQATISRVERGFIDQLTTRALRRILGALEARCDLDVRWRGGQGDQLLDERHASLGARATALLRSLGWQVLPEVTFQHYGERGSIDLLAFREESHAACVIELKSAVYSYEETQRTIDVKARLAPTIVRQRLGWRPAFVGVVLVLEATTTNRRRLHSIRPIVRAGLPAGAREIRRWLANPSGPMRGLWFLPPTHARTLGRVRVGPSRVRTAATATRPRDHGSG